MNFIVILGIILSGIGAYLIYYGQKIDNKKSVDPVEIAKEAMRKENKPQIDITTTTIDTCVSIVIEVKNSPLTSITVYYPLQGIVKFIKDDNSLLAAKSSIMRIIGQDTGEATNNAEFLIENISLNTKLYYKIFFKPTLKGFKIGGRDRYTIKYNWQYKGSNFSDSEMHLMVNDQLTTADGPDVQELIFYNHALTPEQVKTSMEQLGKKRDIK